MWANLPVHGLLVEGGALIKELKLALARVRRERVVEAATERERR